MGVFHLAAILQRGKSVVVIRPNSAKTHPASLHRKSSGVCCRGLHAEEHVLMHSRPGDTVYVVRYRVDGSRACAKPCSVCEARLRAAGIRKVYYTDHLGEWRRL